MRRMFVLLALIVFPVVLAAAPGRGNMSVSMNDRTGELRDCSDLRVTFDGQPAVTAEESVPAESLRSLAVRAPENGGISVTGSDAASWEVRACKAAALGEVLDQVHTRINGNEVTAEGPDRGRWVVYFLVRAPKNASVELHSQNGPISVRAVDGTVTAAAVNGPISVKETSGNIEIDTQNGPISLDGGSGSARLHAENGPITVRLRGTEWNGSLDAHTENGPLSLRLPAGFQTGVVVESQGHGPALCRAEACRGARRTWSDEDDNQRMEFGSGPAAIHLSTVNGPVVVKD